MNLADTKHLKIDHEPADLDEPSKVLLAAASYLEDCGWIQGVAFAIDDLRSPACAFGAIYRSGRYAEGTVAEQRMYRALGKFLGSWNDEKGRTKEQVIAKLRAVALGG